MTIIETEGVVVSETVESAAPKPRFDIDKAIAWLRDPENDAAIKAWSSRVNTAIEGAIRNVDKQVGATATLLKQAFTEDGVGEAIAKDLLKRAFPGDDWDE